MSDDELYRQYLSGDASAGDALMLRNKASLTAYLAAFLHDAQDAEDLMLDCFTVILVDRPRISDGNFRAYLFRMARNKANRLWRLKLKQREFVLDELLPAQNSFPNEQAQKGNKKRTWLKGRRRRCARQTRRSIAAF